jgi:hypothetical protein
MGLHALAHFSCSLPFVACPWHAELPFILGSSINLLLHGQHVVPCALEESLTLLSSSTTTHWPLPSISQVVPKPWLKIIAPGPNAFSRHHRARNSRGRTQPPESFDAASAVDAASCGKLETSSLSRARCQRARGRRIEDRSA